MYIYIDMYVYIYIYMGDEKTEYYLKKYMYAYFFMYLFESTNQNLVIRYWGFTPFHPAKIPA